MEVVILHIDDRAADREERRITIADLEMCAALAREVEALRRMYETLTDIAPKTPTLSCTPSGGNVSSPTESAVLSIERLQTVWSGRIEKMCNHILMVEDALEGISGVSYECEMRIVMRLYYIEGLTWAEVAERMNYCVDRCITFRNMAFQGLGIPCETKDTNVYESDM
jgi:hypothetical protein